MGTRDSRLRPDTETFDHGGYRVTVIDAGHLLDAAAGRRLELLRDAGFPEAVEAATLSVTRDPREGAERYLLDAAFRLVPQSGRRVPGVTALGRDPVSALLSWRMATGDRWATRIVDGMEGLVGQLTERFSPPRQAADAGSARVTRRSAGDLAATVTYQDLSDDGQSVVLHASVDRADASVEHVRAMARLLIDVVTEVAGAAAGTPSITLSAVATTGDQVTLDLVGGLDETVGRLRQLAVSFRHPDAMARWGARRPQGLLLYGPPGTGKTMLARALAHEIGAKFEEIHTPDILDKWLGASERNIKAIFARARRYRQPTVMLFDEFDSIIGYAGEGGDSASQAINAVAGIFKQEMNDLIEANPRVIVVATTNFPDRVDASLIRSGRFDVKVLVPAPDARARADILAKLIRQLIASHEVGGFRMFADDLDVDALAAQSQGMTGADLVEVLRRAQLAKAMEEARTGTAAAPISQADLEHHLTELRSEALRQAAGPR